MLKLLLKDIKDTLIRENFAKVQENINADAIPKAQFKFFEITLADAVTNLRYPHRLGFMPKDVITTFVSDSESVIWNYDLFTSEFLDITTSGACTIRAFIGRYRENA